MSWLWRSVVAAPLIKGVLCGVVAGVAIAYGSSLDGYGALLGLALLLYSLVLLAAAAVYLLAAFLVSRPAFAWRLVGALLDTLLTLMIAWALIQVGLIFGGPSVGAPEFDPRPVAVAAVIAAIWIGALIPVAGSLWVGRSRA